MEKLINIFRSRTVWTIVVLFIINGIGGVKDLIPADYLPVIDLILSGVAIYFRVTPKVNFNA